MYAETFPPAVVNPPPTYKSLPDTSSAAAGPLRPEPRADHPVAGFHLAILVAPSQGKLIPAYKLLPDRASVLPTVKFIHDPSTVQLLPLNLEIRPAVDHISGFVTT